eukprot:COSAG02_NODE_5861_length_3981_cov_9.921175_1_plen_96_part_00
MCGGRRVPPLIASLAQRVGAHRAVCPGVNFGQMAVSQSNRTLTKISQDSVQRLNTFMILSVTESNNQFPAENRYPRIDDNKRRNEMLISRASYIP